MLKIMAIATIGIVPFVLSVGEASAQGRNISGTSVRCPHNTCNPGGGQRASSIDRCKASTCRKPAAK
jgi:hypothetical protein